MDNDEGYIIGRQSGDGCCPDSAKVELPRGSYSWVRQVPDESLTDIQEELEKHVSAMLELLGHDLDFEEDMRDTPRRVAKYLQEFHQPQLISEVTMTNFSKPGHGSGMVIETGIPFRGICAHHCLPFTGEACIGYIPYQRIIGLSKMPRLVQAVGLEAPGVQEAMTDRIADLMEQALAPRGVIVVVNAQHTCMTSRGIATPCVDTITSTVRGVFRDTPHARAEFFSLMNMRTGKGRS